MNGLTWAVSLGLCAIALAIIFGAALIASAIEGKDSE